ncbi:hypothetical protein KF707_05720 [Candidatus Obscuribacterales bacterium]|nr:hypothetical protein [Candidatus Obscuribacterales bacterium]
MSSSEPTSTKQRIILTSIVVGIGLLSYLPCLAEPALVSYYSKKLLPEMAAFIPGALFRYGCWLGAVTLVLAVFHDKLIYGLRDLSFRTRIVTLSVFALLMNVMVLTRTWQFPYCIDDAYIIFRYADNMLRFGVPDYDVGSHVNTISSQLHFAILVATGFLTGQRDLPLVSQGINLGQELISLCLLYAVIKRGFNSTKLALYGCGLHVMSAYAILEVMRGKEGPLVIMMMYLLMWAQLFRRKLLAVWVSALMCLVRPEGILVAITSFLFDAREHLRSPVKMIGTWAPPFILVVMVFVGCYLYYGTAMLQGILAKSVIYHAPPMVCIASLSSQLTTSLAGLPYWAYDLLGPLILMFIYGLTVVLLWRYEFLRIYIVSIFLLTGFFGAGNAFMNAFPWYMSWWAPLVPLLYVGLISFLKEQGKGDSTKIVQGIVIAFSLVVVPLRSYLWAPFSEVVSPLPIFYWDNIDDRLRIYEVARKYLNKVAKKTDTCAVVEVGVIGYGCDSKIFDLLGLVTPDALKLYPVPKDKRAECGLSIPPQYARLYKPERILFLDCFGRNGILEDEYFKRNYTLEWFWENNAFGSLGVVLYKRIPTDSPPKQAENR